MTDQDETPGTASSPAPEPVHVCCFHVNYSLALTSYPMKYSEVCCFCGVSRLYTPPQPVPPQGHGPYHPGITPYPWQRTYTTGTFGGTHNGTRNCPCRPENGGSGICGCILGGPVVTY